MSERKIIFRGGSKELTLPVTPKGYRVEKGINVEVVNIHTIGDTLFTGYGTLATIKISCMLPNRRYRFARASEAAGYIGTFESWVKKKTKLRFVVSGAGVNIPVVLQNISWGEQDGTNDVYADLILREYKQLKAAKSAVTAVLGVTVTAREPVEKAPAIQSYTAKYGDTLCSICRRYYGNDSPDTYNRLAKYNGKSNPNLLMTGEGLKIPIPLP